MRRLLPLLIAALLAGCSSRERANPLDPANPDTGGRPQGFNAIAGYAVVTLSWTARTDLAVDGFQLYRLAEGDSLYRPLTPLLPAATERFTDFSVSNSLTYRYRLYYVLRGALVPHPSEDVATPGRLRAYVADAGAREIVQISPDGRDAVQRFTQFGDVQSLALDPSLGLLWAASDFDALVGNFFPQGFGTTFISGISRPFSMAVDIRDHSVWICDLSNRLLHRSSGGASISPGEIPLLDTPTGVAVNAQDYSVWVCENGGQRVRHFSDTGIPIATAFLSGAPSRVATDSLSRLAWVTSLTRGRIWRVAPNGAIVDSSSAAAGPLGITIDRDHARVWVADAVGDRVLALDLFSMAVLVNVSGIGEPRDVAVDRASGEVWVVARAGRTVLRLANDGTVLQRMGGFVEPYEIQLDPATP